jgi:hypothetical protein
MKTVFSTNNVHARDKFDFWHSAACKNLVDHNSLPKCRLTFDAQIEMGYLGNLELVLFHNSPMQISHTAHHIAHAKSSHVFLCRQVAGAVFLEQDTREIALEAGDVALLDPLLPYEGNFSADSENVSSQGSTSRKDPRHGCAVDKAGQGGRPSDVLVVGNVAVARRKDEFDKRGDGWKSCARLDRCIARQNYGG